MKRVTKPAPVPDEASDETAPTVAPTSPAPPPPPPPALAEDAQPQHGGSFLRQADGSLTLVERTLQPGETDKSQEA